MGLITITDPEESLGLTAHASPIDSSFAARDIDLVEKASHPTRSKSFVVHFLRLALDSEYGAGTKRARTVAGLAWTAGCMLFGVLCGYSLYTWLYRDQLCTAHVSHGSATLKSVPIRYEDRQFDGRFMNPSIYRQNASDEVDAAWDALGINIRPGIIPAKYAAESGLTDAHVQVSEKYGGGFIVSVEGMHHLHCLDLLRQGLWFNFDHYHRLHRGAFKNDKHILQLHMTHCLDTVRQTLMCNVDAGVLGQVWVGDQRDGAQAFPDFQTTHRCRNFDDVRRYAESIQAPPTDELPGDYLQAPLDGQVLPHTP